MGSAAVKDDVVSWPVGRPGMAMRLATPEDFDGIIALLRVMERENSLVEANWSDVGLAVRHSIGENLCFVVDKNHKIVASTALYIGAGQWFNRSKKHIGNYFFFVHPAHRSFPLAKVMVDTCKQAASIVGLPLTISLVTRCKAGAKFKFFERLMSPIGGTFIWGNSK